MKVLPDDDDTTDAFSKARSRVNRWAILEKGGSTNQVFQKDPSQGRRR
ncbi:unnamed protein product [Ectocarpus sp. 8 AP-2014]